MAKKKKSKKSKKEDAAQQQQPQSISLEDIDAMSVDDDDENGGSSSSSSEDWNAEALALRKAIQDGAFNHLLDEMQQNDGHDDDEMEEVELGDDDENDEDEEDDESDGEEGEEEDLATKQKKENDDDVDSGDNEENDDQENEASDSNDDEEDDEEVEKETNHQDSEDDSSSSSDENDEQTTTTTRTSRIDSDIGNGKALMMVTQELINAKRAMPWPETFDVVVMEEPLPFGGTGASGNPMDVHDDLKRELAFYNNSLLAAKQGRRKCEQANLPFSRPVDFFAEMVKTDDHMARVKDRLIFETKKMDAVTQRKSNKEQKLRAKEAHANKVAEKARRKKEHLTSQWKEDVNGHLIQQQRASSILLPNKKRQAANRKYGFGGKRGRFKNNSEESMNDMRDYNPRGNFPGGRKAVPNKKRPGKRARDAARRK